MHLDRYTVVGSDHKNKSPHHNKIIIILDAHAQSVAIKGDYMPSYSKRSWATNLTWSKNRMKILTTILAACLTFSCSAYSENVSVDNNGVITRYEVPHGWLVTFTNGIGSGIIFYPDETHQWTIPNNNNDGKHWSHAQM
jgi:hypothetical protein